MQAVMRRSLVVSLLFAMAAVAPVRAYCVSRSCDPDAEGGEACAIDASTGCSRDGIELSRPDGCIYVAVQAGVAEAHLQMSDVEYEQTVLQAFDAWTEVECPGGGKPGIVVQSAGVVDVDGLFACFDSPHRNIDTWLLDPNLTEPQVVSRNSGATAGVTHTRYVEQGGEIYDADVSLNALWFVVQDAAELPDLLRVVATHEAGHVLGLAHSPQQQALMFREYRVTPDRMLTDDDIEGICALYPPQSLDCPPPTDSPAVFDPRACNEAKRMQSDHDAASGDAGDDGCSIAAPGRSGGGGGGLLLLLAVASALRLRRRRRRLPLAVAVMCCLAGGCDRDGDKPAASQHTEPPVAPQRPALELDEALIKTVADIARGCELQGGTTLRCEGSPQGKLAKEFLSDERSRIEALPTWTALLGNGDPKVQAVASEVVASAYSFSLGGGVERGDVSQEVADAFLGAFDALPERRAARVAPAATHVATLANRRSVLDDILARRADPALRAKSLRRAMIYGRLEVFPEVKKAAAGDDLDVAVAAVEAARNMPAWTEQEQQVLCPWLLEIFAGEQVRKIARASQALVNCHGPHVDRLLSLGDELRAAAKLDRVRLVAFREICKHPAHLTDGRCKRNIALLLATLEDERLPHLVRTGALAAISYQASKTPAPDGLPDRGLMEEIGRRLSKNPDAKLALAGERVLKRLAGEASRAAARQAAASASQ